MKKCSVFWHDVQAHIFVPAFQRDLPWWLGHLATLICVLALASCSSPSPSVSRHTTHTSVAKASIGSQLPISVKHSSRGEVNPTRLIIPAIQVNAPIESLGIVANGDLATPTQSPWTDVGWYNGGPRPGERGSAVIDGHLDRPGGYPAVLWRLRDLQPSDEVTVEFSDGTTRHFRVARVAAYPPQDAPLQDIFGNINGNYLNLITCAGDWIPSEHQTTLRLVVYTTLM